MREGGITDVCGTAPKGCSTAAPQKSPPERGSCRGDYGCLLPAPILPARYCAAEEALHGRFLGPTRRILQRLGPQAFETFENVRRPAEDIATGHNAAHRAHPERALLCAHVDRTRDRG